MGADEQQVRKLAGATSKKWNIDGEGVVFFGRWRGLDGSTAADLPSAGA
jgi:hypothetical protein